MIVALVVYVAGSAALGWVLALRAPAGQATAMLLPVAMRDFAVAAGIAAAAFGPAAAAPLGAYGVLVLLAGSLAAIIARRRPASGSTVPAKRRRLALRDSAVVAAARPARSRANAACNTSHTSVTATALPRPFRTVTSRSGRPARRHSRTPMDTRRSAALDATDAAVSCHPADPGHGESPRRLAVTSVG